MREVGSVSLLDDTSLLVEQTFPFAALDKPVTITRLSPSCHRASAVLSGTGDSHAAVTLPFMFAPNTSATVTVSVVLSELRPGAFTKSVIVYDKPVSPEGVEFVLARLAVRGTLLPAVTFATGGSDASTTASNLVVLPLGALDLSVPRNRHSSNAEGVILFAKPDPRLFRNTTKNRTAATVPPLVSSHPGIRAERLKDTQNGTLLYRVLGTSDAPIGSLLSTLVPTARDRQ